MDVQKMLEILKRDYGIESKEELIERFESSKGINIGIFTERRQTASLIKSLEQNLKENLAKDTIERMNIPEVLKKLSSIGAKQVTETSLPE